MKGDERGQGGDPEDDRIEGQTEESSVVTGASREEGLPRPLPGPAPDKGVQDPPEHEDRDEGAEDEGEEGGRQASPDRAGRPGQELDRRVLVERRHAPSGRGAQGARKQDAGRRGEHDVGQPQEADHRRAARGLPHPMNIDPDDVHRTLPPYSETRVNKPWSQPNSPSEAFRTGAFRGSSVRESFSRFTSRSELPVGVDPRRYDLDRELIDEALPAVPPVPALADLPPVGEGHEELLGKDPISVPGDDDDVAVGPRPLRRLRSRPAFPSATGPPFPSSKSPRVSSISSAESSLTA